MPINPKESKDIKSFVCYILWTRFYSEMQITEIEAPDIQAAVAHAPNRAYCFGFYEQEVASRAIADASIDGPGEPTNHSGLFFINGLLLDEYSARQEGLTTHSPGEYVKTRYGTFVTFKHGRDRIVYS